MISSKTLVLLFCLSIALVAAARIPLRPRSEEWRRERFNLLQSTKNSVGVSPSLLERPYVREILGRLYDTLAPAGDEIDYLHDYYNAEFVGPIWVGGCAARKEFEVVFDTGSSNLWIPGSKCTDKACIERPRYNNTASCSSKPDQGSITIQYGTGSMVGDKVIDNVDIGPINLEAIEFAAATKMAAFFAQDTTLDGILGLAYPNIAQGQITPPFDYMMSRKLVDQDQFIFHLSSKQGGNDSYIDFGGSPKGSIQWVPVTRQQYWGVEFKGISVNGQDTGLCGGFFGCPTTIVDSGTSLLAVPQSKFAGLENAIGKVKSNCSNKDSLPTLTVNFGNNVSVKIPSSIYVLEQDGQCQLGIQAFNSGFQEIIILGDTFMRALDTVTFDRANNRVGFVV